MPGDDWRIPPHLAHDDPLLACLADIVRLVGNPCSPQALSGGLPLVDNKLVPSLLPRAAARAGCSARMARRSLNQLPAGLLPAMLLLKNQRACVLLAVDGGTCQVQYPEAGAPVTVDTRTLEADYTGLACFIHPQFKFDKRTTENTQKRTIGHWFWRAVFANAALYRDAIIAAGLLNLFALAMPLFSMNVYDRVVPNNALETLWAMAIGITLVILFDLLLSVVRSHVVDTASKRIDISLSALIMERVMDIRMANKPSSVGSFAANLRSFESIRDFIASASLTTLVDIPFVCIFLGVLGWISPFMLVPPVVGIIAITAISLVAQFRLKKLVSQSFQASSQRNGVLVESLGSLETIKTLNAQGYAQRNWESSTKFLAQVGSRTKLATTLTVNAVQAIQKLVTVSVVVIGVYLAQNAELTVGGIIASSMIAGRCIGPFTKVASLLMQFQSAKTSLGSIDGYMKLPVEHPPEKEFISRPVFN
ncbi:MAG: type I secretion system permease/ATPase, partial [Alcaligenaceae bacterium]|nr:type I secretion system permease/ATPase [Alcaligenaceae bacterium]